MIKIENLNDKDFITINDLSETLGTSQNTIYRICDRKELNKYKFRGKNWFRTEEVISYLNSKGILSSTDSFKINMVDF
jgi:excisionase family DNA binding protein